MMSYDEILAVARGLEPPETRGHLAVEWLVPERLAVGRDAGNRHLLVMGGTPVSASLDSVRQALMPGQWTTEGGEHIDGTVLRLHPGEHFMVAATTIAVELLRRGLAERSVADVFREVESFVELVIRRILLPPEALLGLVGELLVLESLARAVKELPEAQRLPVSSIWQGHSRNARDFRFKRLGLEVKTTGGPSSVHRVGGLDQIEPRMLEGEHVESLRLVSIGLQHDVTGNSRFSVARLTESILGELDEGEERLFLDQLQQYGPDECVGYDHATMATWEPYAKTFSTTFPPRIYDMADSGLGLFRRAELQQHFPHVVPNGLSFTIDLPDVVPGSHGANPKTGLRAELSRLMVSYA